ncbi:hypothetical protein PIROE2DRAFT_17281 [Piromyces sp. E2]|nr:hypothetical protein PIROE2DRAFT_17281 [Piromyces sp. E2]|eukprot:OUM57663.1 hypothetical protein PIROE2DRAFT_17281 [Piromyces sp. E2]
MERCTIEKEGFMGVYYPGTYAPEKTIIAVGGAMCDELTSISMTRFLRQAGYNVLVLAYYYWKGHPNRDTVSIPIDYVEKAVHWLKTTKSPISKIAMTGISTGAVYTLVSASLIPDIGCVIPVVPFDYVMEGSSVILNRYHRSIYKWHGKDIPYSPWSIADKGRLKLMWRIMREKKLGQMTRYCYDHNKMQEESRIKVEQMHADVLLLAVKYDEAWPSAEAVERIVKVLKEAHYPYRLDYKIYEKASHVLADGLDELKGYVHWVLKHNMKNEKNFPKECEESRQDSFQRILKFLEEWQ